ncbi:hypothetical protein OFN64_36480, partial [Escherichia coli]|nr:hypothetical protein [Escherichia coli]
MTVQSLRDAATYDEKHRQAGGSVTLGPSPGASLSASSTRLRSDYASVTEQSALRAGDGGFDMQVAGTTRLAGGAIT